MSNECDEMIQYCEKIRNEIFRHLTILSGWRQTSTSIFFVVLTIIITLFGISISIVYGGRNELYYIIGGIIITFLTIYTIAKITRMAFSKKYILPVFASRDYKYHEKALLIYMNELEKCCLKLSNENCDKLFIAPCLDLEDLKIITNYEARTRQNNYKRDY
ncbi:MAG: hypothetical protein GU359_06085 [Desulfurococcales archaeon]|jgi:hypothetical protein|nr:hypothetical protein [Desulfurococcales archaeon]